MCPRRLLSRRRVRRYRLPGGGGGGGGEALPPDSHLFTLLPSSYTGVHFENRLTESADFNVFNYRNSYNGGGVALGDVNGDGRLDIYVCHGGYVDGKHRANELYVNQGLNVNGVPTFVEMAAAYGIADTGYSTQAVFFDYDRDGDLDLLLLRNSPRPVSSFGAQFKRTLRDPNGGARLYRNDGGHFVDVSEQAGIYGSEIGF